METLTDLFDLLIHSDKLIRLGGLAMLLVIIYLETGVFFGFIFAGDALLFSAGLLCGTDILDIDLFALLFLATIAAFAGNLTGYYTGKFLGKKLHAKNDSWFFKRRHLEKTHLFYEKYGGMSLIAGRFIWIVRTFVPILAGASDMSFRRFNLFNLIGAFLWVWTMVPLGYFAGHLIPDAKENLGYFILAISVIATLLLLRGIYNVTRNKKEQKD
ncbi:MAG: VTT domain-containing protein [Bacteroidales bacterium]|nr:VTT domain-containing protein [Bacteroidales bacterium]